MLAPFLPPPPADSEPPSLWGDAPHLRALLAANSLEVRHDETADLEIILSDADSAASLLIETAGHIIAERDHLTQQGRWQQLRQAVAGLVGDRADPTPDGLLIKLAYRITLAERR